MPLCAVARKSYGESSIGALSSSPGAFTISSKTPSSSSQRLITGLRTLHHASDMVSNVWCIQARRCCWQSELMHFVLMAEQALSPAESRTLPTKL